MVDDVVDIWTDYRVGRERGTREAFESGAGDGRVVRVRGVPLTHSLTARSHLTVGREPGSRSVECFCAGECELLTVPPPIRSDGRPVRERPLSAIQVHLWREDPEGAWRVRNVGLNPVRYQRWGHRFDEMSVVSTDRDGTPLAGRTTLWIPDDGTRRRLLVVPRGGGRQRDEAGSAPRLSRAISVRTAREPEAPTLAPLPSSQLHGLMSIFPEHLSFPALRNPRIYGRKDLGGRYDAARGAVRYVIGKLDEIGWRHPKMMDTDGRPRPPTEGGGRAGTEDVVRIEVLEELLTRGTVRFEDVADAARRLEAGAGPVVGLYLLDPAGQVIADGRSALGGRSASD
ncbi:hypothetical protein [Frankia tisae]|uniref:hypothetical protein n=1 Tax=Frankia tisae TaxID=2950104 RepID=UPI0021C0349C|nr:hypothetical protein [Frankia tisae]